MALLFGASMATILLAILAADAIRNEVMHTRKSLAVLAWEVAGSVAAAAALNLLLLRAFEIWARVVLFIIFAVFLFLAAAYLTVESWRRAKVRQFDAPIQDLRRRLAQAQQSFDQLTWDIHRLERERRPEPLRLHDPEQNWRRTISDWESAPGLARLRSLKTQEWREEIAKLDDIALEARRRALTAQLTTADRDRHDQVSAQLAIVELERHRRRNPGEAEPASERELGPLEAAKARREAIEREVRDLQSEMRALMRRRDQFLRERVPLD